MNPRLLVANCTLCPSEKAVQRLFPDFRATPFLARFSPGIVPDCNFCIRMHATLNTAYAVVRIRACNSEGDAASSQVGVSQYLVLVAWLGFLFRRVTVTFGNATWYINQLLRFSVRAWAFTLSGDPGNIVFNKHIFQAFHLTTSRLSFASGSLNTPDFPHGHARRVSYMFCDPQGAKAKVAWTFRL